MKTVAKLLNHPRATLARVSTISLYQHSVPLHLLFPFFPFPPINMAQRYSEEQVKKHNTANDLWIIVDEDVYDLTSFADEHPGGKKSEYSARNMLHHLPDPDTPKFCNA